MLIVSVFLLALLWGCMPPAPHRYPVVIGDSVTVGLQTEGYLNVLGPSRDVDAVVGRGVQTTGRGNETGLSAVRRLAPSTRKGDWVIVELGTNDVMGYPDSHPLVRAVLAAIPADRCVAWVTVWNPKRTAASDAWNGVVRAELAKRDCSKVIDWHAAVAGDRSLVGTDGIHPTTKGKRTLSGLYGTVLDAATTARGGTAKPDTSVGT
jgi:lysophospholipase L1-like esterase